MDPFDETIPLAGRVAWDIDRTLDRLTRDPRFLVDWWSIWRSREPVLTALESDWPRWSGPDLLALRPDQMAAATAFHDARVGVVLWARTTDAMPQTWEARIVEATRRLERLGRPTIDRLGGVPDPPRRGEVIPAWWQDFRR